MEGNSLEQTDLVINEGQTISEKSMREHLEAINHQEAIVFIKNSIQKNVILSEKKSFPCILSFYEEFYLKKPVTIEQAITIKIKLYSL
jgi:Fic family protein